MKNLLRAASVCLLASLLTSLSLAQAPQFKNLDSLSTYIQSTHKAPFDRDSVRMPPKGMATLLKRAARSPMLKAGVKGTNVKVNQDRNPWPKAEIGSAVDPLSGKN